MMRIDQQLEEVAGGATSGTVDANPEPAPQMMFTKKVMPQEVDAAVQEYDMLVLESFSSEEEEAPVVFK